MATGIERNNSITFTAFLEEIEMSINSDLAIHVVMDNGSSHTTKATKASKAWLDDHPRFVVHHTPVHASWLNQVEACFSILTRKRLRRGEFESRQELVDKMLAFIDHYGTTATPFKWVYDAKTKAA
jgi:transposase